MAIERLDTATLEALCGVLGDAGDGLTGSEIGGLLRQCQIDVAPGVTRRRRLSDLQGAGCASAALARLLGLVERAQLRAQELQQAVRRDIGVAREPGVRDIVWAGRRPTLLSACVGSQGSLVACK